MDNISQSSVKPKKTQWLFRLKLINWRMWWWWWGSNSPFKLHYNGKHCSTSCALSVQWINIIIISSISHTIYSLMQCYSVGFWIPQETLNVLGFKISVRIRENLKGNLQKKVIEKNMHNYVHLIIATSKLSH